MKNVTMFKLASCPHCRRAFAWMEEVFSAHPEYRDVPLTVIDEGQQRELADKYDYYYVPTYYVGEEKVHEGVASYEKVEAVFRAAYGK